MGWRDKLYGCYGSYSYRPEEFDPEANLTISVSTSAGKMEYVIPKETLHRIREDFRPFFEKHQ